MQINNKIVNVTFNLSMNVNNYTNSIRSRFPEFDFRFSSYPLSGDMIVSTNNRNPDTAREITTKVHNYIESLLRETKRQPLLIKANILDSNGNYVEGFFSNETIKKDKMRKEK